MLGWTTFEKYDEKVLLLLEEIQIEWLAQYISDSAKSDLSIIFKHYPIIHWFFTNKAPKTKKFFDKVKDMNTPETTKIEETVQRFLPTIEDWLVYVIDPDIYGNQPFNKWETSELLNITDFNTKTVIDIGVGTGSQTFRAQPYAKHIYGVEPIQSLRTYVKNKAASLNIENISIVDGLMTELPFDNDFADIIMSGHVFGDAPEQEFKEMMRVLKPGGVLILIPGNNDSDNDRHKYLVEQGCQWGRFEEPGDGIKRKYWIKKEQLN